MVKLSYQGNKCCKKFHGGKIMKLRKILPLVLVAPLLASCGSGLKVEEPSFDAYANKVEHAAYFEALHAAMDESVFVKADKIGSLEAKVTHGEKTDYKYDGVENAPTLYMAELEAREIKYDSVNLMLQSNMEESAESETSGFGSSDVASGKTVEKYQAQKDTVKEVESSVSYDLEAGTYSVIAPVVDWASELDTMVKGQIVSQINLPELSVSNYDALSDEEKAKFSFYQDDKVFTVVYETSSEHKMYDATSEEKEIGKFVEKQVKKLQINLSSSNMRYVTSDVSTMTGEVTADGKLYSAFGVLNVKVGNKIEAKQEEYLESKVEFKDVSIEKLDITKFVDENAE